MDSCLTLQSPNMHCLINDTEQAIAATHWCISNFKNDDWDLGINGLFGKNIVYKFTFFNKKDHLLFLMKWI